MLLSLGVAAGNVIKGTFRQTYTPHHLLGRVTVSMQLLNFGTIPLGALLGGALGATLGLRPTMWVMTAGVSVRRAGAADRPDPVESRPAVFRAGDVPRQRVAVADLVES